MNDFEQFVLTQCLVADLMPGKALWVPYGWRCVLLTRTHMALSHALRVPYVCSRMIHASAMKDRGVEYAKRVVHDWGTMMGSGPCLSMSREALAWVENLDTIE
ncbi:MAG: hypothetical protein ACKPKO_47095, partial [Candidatus Fonsibacter sp.]